MTAATATAGGAGPGRGGSRRGAGVVVAVAAGLLAVALVGGRPDPDLPPLDPRSHQPDGASALVALLRALDVEVELSVGLPGPADDVALVLVDRLDRDQRAELLAWVEAGGRLVVADPGSALAPVPARPGEAADAGLVPGVDGELAPVGPGTCTVDALRGVGDLDPGLAVAFRVPGGAASCFGTGAAALVVAEARGAGTVVALGAPGVLVNDRLDRDGNAPVAAALLDPRPGSRLRVVDPPAPVGGGDATLLELVPDGVQRALLQLGVAFLLYAAWRAVRLGRPVAEVQPVALAGSELVNATGRMLAATGSPGTAAESLRADLRRDLAARLGVPAGLDPGAMAGAVTARTTLDPALLGPALGPDPVRTDDELVAAARAVAAVRQEVL